VKVVDAIYLIIEVDGERDAVEAIVADAAPEAAGVVIIAHGLKYLWKTKLNFLILILFYGSWPDK
jgi:hypothetical protein